jgi:hypothetical protein
VSALNEVKVASLSPERFESLLGDRYDEVDQAIDEGRRLLRGCWPTPGAPAWTFAG